MITQEGKGICPRLKQSSRRQAFLARMSPMITKRVMSPATTNILLEKRGELFERLIIGLIRRLKPVGCGTRLGHIPLPSCVTITHSKF